MAAMRRFDNGPASDTHMTAAGERRDGRYGLIWTGLAQPKPTAISINEPIGSRCANGLSVRRPSVRGVGSPNLSAVQACANSCTAKAVNKTTMRAMSVGRLRANNIVGVLGGHYTTP